MKKLIILSLFALLLLQRAPAWAELNLPESAWAQIDPKVFKELSPEEMARLKKGEIVILKEMASEGDDKTAYIRALLVLNKPIEKIWSLITKTERQVEYLSNIDEVTLVSRDGTGDIVEFHLSFGFIKVVYRVIHRYGDNYYLYWSLDPNFKNDLKELKGFWQYFKLDDNTTLARYGTRVKASSLIPKFVEEYMTKRDLPKALDDVKRWLDTDGAFNKNTPEPKKKEAPKQKSDF
jgi:hypothetical protein